METKHIKRRLAKPQGRVVSLPGLSIDVKIKDRVAAQSMRRGSGRSAVIQYAETVHAMGVANYCLVQLVVSGGSSD